jgi:TPR repeat protein
MKLVTAFLLLVAALASAETSAYIYGRGGFVAGDYKTDDDVYQKLVVSLGDNRQVNNGQMYSAAGYVLNRAFFADKRVKPYFGGFFNGVFTKGANMHNGVIAYGFGPDLGVLLPIDLRQSYLLITAGYQYKKYSITGTQVETMPGDDPPSAPHYNYTYIPTGSFPTSASSYYANLKMTLQLHRRAGVEANMRYDGDLNDSFNNGMSFLAGPSFWL